MPQLDIGNYPPQIFWLVISFIVLYLLISRVALPRITDVIEERQSRIQHDLDEAERLKAEAEEALAGYEAAIAAAREEAHAHLSSARNQVSAELETERQKADAEIAEQTGEAEAAIEAAKNEALKGVRDAALETAKAIVARIGAGEVDDTALSAAVDRQFADKG